MRELASNLKAKLTNGFEPSLSGLITTFSPSLMDNQSLMKVGGLGILNKTYLSLSNAMFCTSDGLGR